jgi:5-methylcytosine-specific restriction protein A
MHGAPRDQPALPGHALSIPLRTLTMPRLRSLPARIGTAVGRLAVMQPGSWRTDKQSSTVRGYGYKWQQARAGYLRKHPFCVYCLRDLDIDFFSIAGVILACAERDVPVPYGNVVDHRIPHRGDMELFWDTSNWATMCTPHHSGEKQRAEARA